MYGALVYEVHRLRLLVELSRRGTLSAVAAALSYSPSTISQQLSQLEVEVGTPLLEPVGRRVRLTPQAEILVSHAETVLRQLEAAETAVARSLAEVTGRVRLATFQTVGTDRHAAPHQPLPRPPEIDYRQLFLDWAADPEWPRKSSRTSATSPQTCS